jgi:tape measure domain-containing protein
MAAAELKLNVTLDLAFFRQQLQKLTNIAQSEFTPQLKIKFNRSIIDSELNALQKSIKRRAWAVNLQVNDTTVKTAQDNVDKLRKSLDDLTSKTYELRIGTKGTGGKTAAQQISEIENILKNGLSGKAFGGGAVASARSNVERQALVDKISKGSLSKGGYNKAGIEEVIRRLGATPGGSDVKGLRAQAVKLAKSVDDAIISRVWNDVKDLQMNMNRSRFMKDLGKLPQVVRGVGTSSTGFAKTPETINKEATLGITDALAQGSKSVLNDLLSFGKGLVSLERGIARFLRGLPSSGLGGAVSNAMSAGGRSSVGSGLKGAILGATGGGLTGAATGAFKATRAVAAQGLSQWTEGGSLAHGLGAGMRQTASILGGNTAGLEKFVEHGKEQIANAIVHGGIEAAVVGTLGTGLVAGSIGFARGFASSMGNDAKGAIWEIAKAYLGKGAQLALSVVKFAAPIAGKGLAIAGQGLATGARKAAPYAAAGGIVAGEYAGKGLQVASDRLEDALIRAYVAINGIPDGTTWNALKQRVLSLMGAMEVAAVQISMAGEASRPGVRNMLREGERASGARLSPVIGTYVEDLGNVERATKYLPRPGEGQSGRQIQEGLNNIAKAAAEAAKQALNKQAREIANQMRSVSVSDLGNSVRALMPGNIAGLLPAGIGRQAQSYRTSPSRADIVAQRVQQAQERSRLRSIDVMGEISGRTANPYSYSNFSTRFSRDRVTAPQRAIVPYDKPGALVYQGFPPGGGGSGGGPGNVGAAYGGYGGGGGGGNILGQLSNIKLPGAGVVNELADEFANATKQVLLFGTAYKALAFAQALPGQVVSAVSALQSFRNTLNAISPSAKDAANSNQFILDTVEKYNIPLQSARDGFTKLYASMKPAGFSGEQINNLFLGISKASATLGLSRDKVDRVTYAFSQMASKGQLMSEEVSGQLGDVIPGALSIMAEAANMDIKTFKKAMEDGVFVGKAFEAVMSNVPIVLEKRFGKGAEGAAKTFQGAINNMQTSLVQFYESFEPLAVNFLNTFVNPLTAGIKTVTDGLSAYFTGQQAATEAGGALAAKLAELTPTFNGLAANAKSVGEQLLNAAKVAGYFLEIAAKILGNPLTGWLLKVYVNVLLLQGAFKLLGGQILLSLIQNIGVAIARFAAFNAALRASAASATLTQSQMLLLSRSANAALAPVNMLRTALIGLASFALITIAIQIVVNGLTEMREAEARLARLRGEKNPVGPAGPRMTMTAARRYAGATREKLTSDQQKQAEFLGQLRADLVKAEGGSRIASAMDAAGQKAGGINMVSRTANARVEELKLRIKDAEDVINLNPRQFKTAAERQRASVATTMAPIGGGASTGGKTPREKKERESQVPQLQLALALSKEQFALDMQMLNARLSDNIVEQNRIEGAKELLGLEYQIKAIKLEEIPANEKQLKIAEVQVNMDKARFEANAKLGLAIAEQTKTIQENIAKAVDGYKQEVQEKQRYNELLAQGIVPTLAKAYIEIERTFSEQKKQLAVQMDQLEVSIKELEARKDLTKEEKDRLDALRKYLKEKRGAMEGADKGEGAAKGAAGEAQAPTPIGTTLAEGLDAAQQKLRDLTDTGKLLVGVAGAIGDAFGNAFKGLISGSMTAREAFASLFQNVANYFTDMVAQMIAEWLKAQVIKGFMSLVSMVIPGFGGGGGGGGAGIAGGQGIFTAANGGIAQGGFRAFASGGIVTGPTLGLVGEGRYNEAVIPLPDGKSVPVDLGGAGIGGNQITSNIVVNVSSDGQSQSQQTGNGGADFGRKLEGAVKQVIINEMRPGGTLSGMR